MTPDEKTNKIADLAIRSGQLRRERDEALALVAACPTCQKRHDDALRQALLPSVLAHLEECARQEP